MTNEDQNTRPQSVEPNNIGVFDTIINATRQTADLLACAYNTMRKEMLDAGMPRDLAEDAAAAHTRKIIADMFNRTTNGDPTNG